MASDYKQLGAYIQFLRQKSGLTQDALSDKASLSYSTLAKIERGAIKNPSVYTVAALADALGCSVEQILEGNMPRSGKHSKEIKFIYSDINGVLVRFFQKAFVDIAHEHSITVEKVETAFWHYNDAANRGEMSPEALNQAMMQRLGIKEFDWQARYLSTIEPIIAMHECLADISATHKIGLLSNINRGVIAEMLDLSLLPDLDYSAIVDSSEVGSIKPEAKIYQIAERLADHSGDEILFIDDSRTNLMAAERFGWRVLWFDDYRPQESVERVKESLGL